MITQEEINSKYFDFEIKVRALFNKTVDEAIAGLLERMANPTPAESSPMIVCRVPRPTNIYQQQDDDEDAELRQAYPRKKRGKSNTLTMPADATVPAGVPMGAVGAEARSEPYEAPGGGSGEGSPGDTAEFTNITRV